MPPSQKSRGLRSKDLLGQLTGLVEAQLTEIIVQVPPGNAGRIRLRPTVHEPHVLLLKKSTSAMSTGKLWNKNCRQTTPVSLLGSIASPKS